VNEEKHLKATVENISKTGMYFTSRQALRPDEHIRIFMPGYSLPTRGPDNDPIYLAQIVWCLDTQKGQSGISRSGVRLLKSGQDRCGADWQTIRQVCDLCNEPTPCTEVEKIADSVYLCPQCYRYFLSIPEGHPRMSITNQLIGNVL
jgi:hypothetical protein